MERAVRGAGTKPGKTRGKTTSRAEDTGDGGKNRRTCRGYAASGDLPDTADHGEPCQGTGDRQPAKTAWSGVQGGGGTAYPGVDRAHRTVGGGIPGGKGAV